LRPHSPRFRWQPHRLRQIPAILKGEFVAFGEQAAKAYAAGALDKQIAAWEARYNRKAEPENR
jgi:hypothetical protein